MVFKVGVSFPHGEIEYSKLSKEEQLAYMREKNKKSYLKKEGELSRISPLENTPERIAQRAREKSNLRVTRAKQARRDDEFTKFVTSEAHKLRELRNKTTKIKWHVDHIIPLKGTLVSGLHIWNNLRVIPKQLNLAKGNYYSLHD